MLRPDRAEQFAVPAELGHEFLGAGVGRVPPRFQPELADHLGRGLGPGFVVQGPGGRGGEHPVDAVALAGGEAAEAGVVEEAGRVVGPGDVGERPAQDHGRETEQVEHVPQRPLVPGGGRAGRGHVDGLGQSVQVRPLLGGQPQGPGQAV